MLKYPPNMFLVLLQQTKRLKSWHSLERQTLEEYLIRPGKTDNVRNSKSFGDYRKWQEVKASYTIASPEETEHGQR